MKRAFYLQNISTYKENLTKLSIFGIKTLNNILTLIINPLWTKRIIYLVILFLAIPSFGLTIQGQALYSFDRKSDAFFASNLSFSFDGKFLAFGTVDGKVQIYDMNNGKLYYESQIHKGITVSVDFSSKNYNLASGGKDGQLIITDLAQKKVLKTIAAHEKTINQVSFSPGDFQIITASRDNSIKVWDVKSGALIKTISNIKGNVRSVIFNTDGKYIICATSLLNYSIRYYDWQTGREYKIIDAPNSINIAINADETMLASSSLKNELYFWDATTGKPLFNIAGHTDYVKHVEFSPGGNYIVSCSDDKTVKLWDVKNKKLIKNFTGHLKNVISVAYSQDGKKIASSSWDGTVKVWDLSSLNLIDEISYNPDEAKAANKENQILFDEINANLEFDNNKAEIKSGSYAALDKLVIFLKENPNFKLIISGHTDNFGDAANNYKLSRERAQNVANYLISKNIEKQRLTVQGFGASKPIADNSSETGRKINRRVEFQIREK